LIIHNLVVDFNSCLHFIILYLFSLSNPSWWIISWCLKVNVQTESSSYTKLKMYDHIDW